MTVAGFPTISGFLRSGPCAESYQLAWSPSQLLFKKYSYATDHATQCKEPYQALYHGMEDIHDIIADNSNAHHYSKLLVYHGLIV